MRRFDFRGKRRLSSLLPPPTDGLFDASFPEGFRLRMNLAEPAQRDMFYGAYNRLELSLVRDFLAEGGDFVDVGAYIGVFTVAAGVALADRGRVVALEPHLNSARQLEDNVALNRLSNVVVRACAVASTVGEATLHSPRHGDPTWATLDVAFHDDAASRVSTTTVDVEVEKFGLKPACIKIDAENYETEVLDGMSNTLALRPPVICEVGPMANDTRAVHDRLVGLDYDTYWVKTPWRIERGMPPEGLWNSVFVPSERGREFEKRNHYLRTATRS